MSIDGAFFSNDITTDNIIALSQSQAKLSEQRIIEISELAESAADYALEMYRDGYGIYEILSLISEQLAPSEIPIHNSCLDVNIARVTAYLSTAFFCDKAVFTELFCKALNKRNIFINESSFLNTEKGDEVFAYVKNPLADEAYDVFSQDAQDPRVRYASSLKEAARMVSSSECEYCLLPLEERGGSRLSSIAALLFSEDLKINAVIPVFGLDGMADMKYALVAKHFSVPTIENDDDRYLEIRLRADGETQLTELFSVAALFGSQIYRINTISFDTEDGTIPHYSLVFREEGRDFSLMLLYLTLFSGAYLPIGIYKNLE